MTKVKWQDHFKSAIKNAENLYSKDSTDVSLLMFCLRSKLISSEEYLAWAKENFQIPVLSEAYFQVHKPQVELFKKWQKVYKWSNECMPIAEWDGVLIIACLEYPENYTHTNPTTFVLTSHGILDQTWLIYSKSHKSTAAATSGDFADMTAFAATVVASSTADNNYIGADGELILKNEDSSHEEEASEEISAEEGDEESSEKSSGEAPGEMAVEIDEEVAGMPDGLISEAPPPKFGPLTLALSKVDPVAPFPSMDTEVANQMSVSIEDAAEEVKAPKKGPRTSTPLMASLDEKTKIDNVADIDKMEEVDDHEVQFPDKKHISPVTTSAGDLPSAPMKPITSPGHGAAFYLEKIRRQSQDRFDKDVIASFQQMKTFFTKSMLLALGDKDLVMKPILWDGPFDSQKPQIPEFNLKTPSIFKVVSGTQKPYHGYIVPNDLNESFFETWNHGQIPDHVTIVPLMDGDHVVGMIMGFGEKASYNKNVLQFTENVAKGLTGKILKAPNAKVA